MTSKVLVKLPVVPFQQRKKPPPEIAPLPSRNDECDEGRFQGYTSDKVTQLEQNIKFLQDQHQNTLVALHQEVEILRQRNRDLQFQLVFTKGTNYASSSPSSPEDSGNGFVKAKGSPSNVNVAPLQVELLEKDLQDLRASLSEARTRNICLSETVEKQKQKLELIEKSKEKQKDIGTQVDSFMECREVELQARLDDAEALVKRLRLESDEQRKEISNLKSTNSYSSSSSSSNNGHRGVGQNRSQSGYHNRSGGGASSEVQASQEDSYHKFPPLHTQSYWHRGSARAGHSYEHKAGQSEYRRNNRHQQQQQHQQQHHQQQQQGRHEIDGDDSGMLPQLQNGSVCLDSSASYPPFFRQQQTHHNGGNYHRDEQQSGAGFRKYRGKKSRKDFNGQDRRVYQSQQYEQNPTAKDHQQQQRASFPGDSSSSSSSSSRPPPRRQQQS